MSSQWKQFLELYAEKNQHLNKQEVLQMAKKPFQQLKQYYEQRGGTDLDSIPICDELVVDDYDEEDIKLITTEYFPDLYDEFAQKLQNIIIEGDCRAVVVNGKDILYNSYDGNFSEEEKAKRIQLGTGIANLLKELIKSKVDFFFDIYLFPDQWHKGKNIDFGPRKYHIDYDTEKKKITVSIFTKSKKSFGL